MRWAPISPPLPPGRPVLRRTACVRSHYPRQPSSSPQLSCLPREPEWLRAPLFVACFSDSDLAGVTWRCGPHRWHPQAAHCVLVILLCVPFSFSFLSFFITAETEHSGIVGEDFEGREKTHQTNGRSFTRKFAKGFQKWCWMTFIKNAFAKFGWSVCF